MGKIIDTDVLLQHLHLCKAMWYTDDEKTIPEHTIAKLIETCPAYQPPECEYLKALHELEAKVDDLRSEIASVKSVRYEIVER